MKNKMISRLLAITTMSSIMTGCSEIEPQKIVKEPTNVTTTIVDSEESVIEELEIIKLEESIENTETQYNLDEVESTVSSDRVTYLEEISNEEKIIEEEIVSVEKQEAILMEQTKIENVADYEENDFEKEYDPQEDFDRVRAVYGPVEPTEEVEDFIGEDELISYVYGPAPDPEPIQYDPIGDVPVLVYGPAPDQEPIPYDPIDDIPVEVYGPAPYIEGEIFE